MATNAMDPLLGGYTSTTNLSPLQTALQQAQSARLSANQQASNLAVGGYGNQMSAINQGATNAGTYRQPYMQTGQTALGQAAQLAQGGYNIQDDPAFKAMMNQGLRAAEQSASAKGGLYSGAHQLELVDLGQQLANKYIQDVYNRNMGLAQMGQQSSENQAAQAYNQGQQIGNVQSNIGTTQANAALSAGDIMGDTALNMGKAAVAQSTIAGLGKGQIMGAGSGGEQKYYAADTNPDPWGNAAQMAQNAGSSYVGAAVPTFDNAVANAGLQSLGQGGDFSRLGDGTRTNIGGNTGFDFSSGNASIDPNTGQAVGLDTMGNPIDADGNVITAPGMGNLTGQPSAGDNLSPTQSGIRDYLSGSTSGSVTPSPLHGLTKEDLLGKWGSMDDKGVLDRITDMGSIDLNKIGITDAQSAYDSYQSGWDDFQKLKEAYYSLPKGSRLSDADLAANQAASDKMTQANQKLNALQAKLYEAGLWNQVNEIARSKGVE